MNIRTYFLMALVLAIVAIGLHITALDQVRRGLYQRALVVKASESERSAAKAEARRYSSRGIVIGYVGFGFALASAGCAVVSVRRRERARRSLTYALLFVYLMLQFLLV